MRAAKAQTSLRICASSSETSLLVPKSHDESNMYECGVKKCSFSSEHVKSKEPVYGKTNKVPCALADPSHGCPNKEAMSL